MASTLLFVGADEPIVIVEDPSEYFQASADAEYNANRRNKKHHWACMTSPASPYSVDDPTELPRRRVWLRVDLVCAVEELPNEILAQMEAGDL